MDIPQITDKNTKSEIYEAYKQLRELAEQFQKDIHKGGTFRTQILAQIEKIESELTLKQDQVDQLTAKIGELKAKLELGEKIQLTQEQLELMRGQITQEQQSWERRREQLQKEIEEEKKWQQDRIAKELDQKRWEFDLELKKKQKELTEKEQEFAQQLKQAEKYYQEIKAFPAQLEKERHLVEEQTRKKLQVQFDMEQKLIKQEFDSEKRLLEQTIANLEARLKEQRQEFERLQGQLASATSQIKQLAVAALQKHPLEEKETASKP